MEDRRKDYAVNGKRYALNALLRKHDMTLDELAQLWEVQDGRCYLCLQPLPENRGAAVHLDHDHSCCGPDKSCRFCRRGLAHRRCNLLIGFANDDPGRLRFVADNLEAAMRALAARQAERPFALPLWDGAAANGTVEI